MGKPFPVARFVDEWLAWAGWRFDPEHEGKESPYDSVFMRFDDLVHDHPEHAWNVILAVVADPRAQLYLGHLAAGPVEDLLSYHGEKFIDRVELAARSDPSFAFMLGGVWKFKMTDDVWRRVQGVWVRRGWDGNPKDGA